MRMRIPKQKNAAVSNDAESPLILLPELPHHLAATIVIAALDTVTTTATSTEIQSQPA
jgi:hypothetical protein